jgi:hypothetical protein
MVQSVLLRAKGWTARVRFPVGARDFSLFHSVKTIIWAHPTSYAMGAGGKVKIKKFRTERKA